MTHEIVTQPIAASSPKADQPPADPIAQDVREGQAAAPAALPSTKPVSRDQPPSDLPVPGLLRFRDQALLAGVSAVALAAMMVYCMRTSHWGADPIELERQPEHVLDYQIELNSATWVEWSQLPGIGPVLAHRIVQEREENGPFRSIYDLTRVKGIGPKKLEAVRPSVREGPSNDSSQPGSGRPQRAGPARKR